ncbi:MAG: NTP transferase domain-containing protein [Candidatus Tectomicrobia bacterium]|nr:NTP transferase domain-containing protein [Candidatus Tectomicrobia bacterium]
MKAIILAAGGDNLPPFTSSRPKPMIHASGRYLLESTIEHLRTASVVDLILVVGHQKERIVSYFGNGSRFGVRIAYVSQEEERLGIGNALLQAEGRIHPGENFLLVYGDVVTTGNIYLETLQSFNSFKAPVAAICLTPSAEAFGNVYLDDEMRITRLVEKPMQVGSGNYVLAGVFILPHRFFGGLNAAGADMGKALSDLIERDGLHSCIWEQDWVDVKNPWDILRANRMVMDTWHEAVVSDSAELRGWVHVNGPVRIEPGVKILSGTVIEGPCYLGSGTFVGNNVLIRPYTSIGPHSVIGYGVELKNCVLFGPTKVGRLSFIGDSVVGEGANIGSGTVTVNINLDGTNVRAVVNGKTIETGMPKLGSFIGDGAAIGAGNTLLAGTVIRSGSIIAHHGTVPLEV